MRLEVILMIHVIKTQRKITVENTKLRHTKLRHTKRGTAEKKTFDVPGSI